MNTGVNEHNEMNESALLDHPSNAVHHLVQQSHGCLNQ